MSEVVAALMPTTARAVGRPVCWWWLAMCRAWRRLSETPVTTTISREIERFSPLLQPSSQPPGQNRIQNLILVNTKSFVRRMTNDEGLELEPRTEDP